MAQDQIDKIINIQFKYSDLVDGWVKTSASIDEANKKLKGFKSANDAQGVAIQTQLIKALRSEMRMYTKEIQNNIREETAQEGSIEQLRASISKLTSEYNKLSREERKTAQGSSMAKKIADMQIELNEANAALLNFRDNVGNYASAAKGFTPLNFQVQQLARELPSLTMSLQMFFLAISNNVPMFVDELQRARVANAALRSEGKATIPVFRQVVSSLFSWQTALVVGITLLTAYGKEIGEWVKSLLSGQSALYESAKHVQGFNESVLQSREELKREFDMLANAKKGTEEYAAAKNVIEERYGAYLANQREEIRNLEDQRAAYEVLAKSITAAAIARGLEGANAKAAEEYAESIEKAFKGVQEKFVKKFGRDTGIAYFTEFRAGLNSEIPELEKRAREIYQMFNENTTKIRTTMSGNRPVVSEYVETSNDLEKTVNKVRGATDQYNETLSANKIAMETLMGVYKISAEDQEESINDLLKLKEKELADINNEVATTEEEIKARNKRAEAVEVEIKRLRELGRTTKDAGDIAKKQAKEVNKYLKDLSSTIKETSDAENYLLSIIQSAREKTQENEMKTLQENYDKDVQAYWQRLNEQTIDTEVAHETLLALEDKFQRNKQEIIDKYNKEALKESLANAELQNNNRINEARLAGGELAAAEEAIQIGKERLAQIDEMAAKYHDLGYTDEQIQAMRIQSRLMVQDAEQRIQGEQQRSVDEQTQLTQRTLGAAAQAVGGFSAMFEALGGEGERYAQFSKMMAIFEIALQQAQAIAGAVTNAAKFSIPWLLPIQIASSIAAVVAAIAQATKITDSSEVPKYAEGGLITGPGTGTSDSIVARVSNGEGIMTARAVNDWGAILSAINISSGGRAIDTSNLPERGDGMSGLKRVMKQVFQEMPNPVVFVKDINRGQSRASVAVGLGKLGRKQRK